MVPYGQWLEVNNSREGHFLERFAIGSLRSSIGLLKRMRGYFEHGKSLMFDRAPIMELKEVWETESGAFFRASLLEGIPGFILDGIRRGLYGASLGAEPLDVEVERFPGRSPHNPKGLEERTYKELRAYDISLTPSPAYEAATVTLRSKDYLSESGIYRVSLEPVRLQRDYFAGHPARPPA